MLFRAVSIWIDGVDRQIVVGFGELPAAVFFAFHRGLVGEKLFFDFTAVGRGGDICR